MVSKSTHSTSAQTVSKKFLMSRTISASAIVMAPITGAGRTQDYSDSSLFPECPCGLNSASIEFGYSSRCWTRLKTADIDRLYQVSRGGNQLRTSGFGHGGELHAESTVIGFGANVASNTTLPLGLRNLNAPGTTSEEIYSCIKLDVIALVFDPKILENPDDYEKLGE